MKLFATINETPLTASPREGKLLPRFVMYVSNDKGTFRQNDR
jgi:hypothetical protein